MSHGHPALIALAGAAALGVQAARPATGATDAVIFTDITRESGITFVRVASPEKKYILESMSGGVAVFDFDRDGLFDIYLTNAPTVGTAGSPRSARSALWRNRGDDTFEDVTDKAGVGSPGWAMGVVSADYDNDGWDDLYVTCYGPNRLYRNNGDGTLLDVTAKAGVGDARWSTGAAFADYDGDGSLDLFVANYIDVALDALPPFGNGKFCEYHGVPVQCGPRGLKGAGDTLYRNKGNGSFEDVSARAGVADAAGRYGMGVAWADFNGDDRPDLFVANDAGPNFLYRNNGDGTFKDEGLSSGTALSEDGKEQGSMGVALADYDHSGGWSLLVTNFAGEYNALYRHQKAFLFSDVSFASQTARAGIPLVGWGTHFLDYDNDGWNDLLVVNGHVYPQVDRVRAGARYAQPKLLYRNNRNGTFAEVGSSSGMALTQPAVSRGSATIDFDNDGDLDVIVNNLDGAPTLLRNDGGNRGNFLTVELRGSTRSAVGAVVTVKSERLVQRALRRSGDSYLSHSDPRLHFGVGDATRIDAVEVRWPSGATERFGEIPTNAFITIVEGEPRPRIPSPRR